MIEFKNVSKSFHNVRVLKDISMTICKGELTVLIGPSGCGKTTLLKMINRMLAPTSGEIFLDGKCMDEIDKVELRRSMGYVIQQGGLLPHLTVRENIEIIERLEHRPEDEVAARTIQLMKMVSMDPTEYLDRFPGELSGGQQQRIGVARAFANEPEIILFDEPFSALDPITRSALQDQLIHIQSNEAKTMVFVTHDMGEAIKIADRICILNEGRVVQFDTPENIMKYPADEFVESFVGLNRIWSSPKYIKVQDFMITEPISVREDVSAYKCIRILRSHHIDTLPVVDSEGTLLGIIGRQSFLNRPRPGSRARDIMYSAQHTVHPDENILDVLTTIRETDVSNLPVIDDNGRIIGLLTSSRLIATMSQQFLDNMSEEEVK